MADAPAWSDEDEAQYQAARAAAVAGCAECQAMATPQLLAALQPVADTYGMTSRDLLMEVNRRYHEPYLTGHTAWKCLS